MTRHDRSDYHTRCLDTVLSLDPAGSGQESEVKALLSLTIIQFTAHVILISDTQSQQAHICKLYKKALWRWASGEAAYKETLEAVVTYLHTGGLILYGRYP